MTCLLFGYECGGMTRGNQMSLWYDNEKEELLLGDQGYVRGDGENAFYSRIYDYRDGEFLDRASFSWIQQSADHYTEEELLENAELYYDERDRPYTRETISNVGYITEHSVNGELVTEEHYQEVYIVEAAKKARSCDREITNSFLWLSCNTHQHLAMNA